MVYTAGAGEWSNLQNVLGFAKSSLAMRDLFIDLFTNAIYIQKLFQQIEKELGHLMISGNITENSVISSASWI